MNETTIPVVPMTALGLPLFAARPVTGQPIDCIVVVRTLETEGVSYQLVTTPDLDTLLCLGMLGYALRTLEKALLADFGQDN